MKHYLRRKGDQAMLPMNSSTIFRLLPAAVTRARLVIRIGTTGMSLAYSD